MDINLGKVTLQIRIYRQFEIGKQYILHLCAHSQEGTSISLFLTNIYKNTIYTHMDIDFRKGYTAN